MWCNLIFPVFHMLIKITLHSCVFICYCRSQASAKVISGEEHFSSKKCLAWFYEYAGNMQCIHVLN